MNKFQKYLAEDAIKLPPTSQDWHDFNRIFFQNSSSDFEEFVAEYLGWHSGVESFLSDSDNSSVQQSLDDYGLKFLEALNHCTGLEYSEIVSNLARIL